jgi:hypothetical protein
MPFGILKKGGRYAVVTSGTGKVHGHHDTHEKAYAQLKAMYANGADETEGPKQAAPEKKKPSKYFSPA